MSSFLGLYNYWIVIFLMMAGFYNVIARGNLIQETDRPQYLPDFGLFALH